MNTPQPLEDKIMSFQHVIKCTATSKRTGGKCKNIAVKGRAVCRFHGGKSLSGPASPSFRHGRYSKSLPTGLLAQYKRLLSDEKLLTLTDEITLTTLRISTLLEILETTANEERKQKIWREIAGFCGVRRKLVQTEARRLLSEQGSVPVPLVLQMLTTISLAIKTHVQDAHAVAEICRTIQSFMEGDDASDAT